MTGNNIWPESTKNLAMGPTLGRSARHVSYSTLGGLSQAFLAAPLGSRLGLSVRCFLGTSKSVEHRLKKLGQQIAPEKPEVPPNKSLWGKRGIHCPVKNFPSKSLRNQ